MVEVIPRHVTLKIRTSRRNQTEYLPYKQLCMLLCVNTNTKQVHTWQLSIKDREIQIVSKIKLTGLKEEKTKPLIYKIPGSLNIYSRKKQKKYNKKKNKHATKKFKQKWTQIKKGTKAVQLSFLIC